MKSRALTFASLAAPLPRSQTQAVIDRLQEHQPRVTCQLNVLQSPVADAEKNREIFVALSRGEIHYLESVLQQEQSRLIVVEAADMVLPLPDDLAVLCVPDRAAPFDAYLNRQGLIMDDMKPGGQIGVLSMRSRSQMAALWPELVFRILPGGVDKAMETHMRRAEIDGLIVPAAVTEHLGIQGVVAEIYAPDFILPSPGQGILAVIGRSGDTEARELLAPLHSADTAIELATEQAFCRRMISDQDLPVGALAKVEGGEVAIVGATGAGMNRIVVNGDVDQAEAVGAGLAQQILSSGESFVDLLEADFPDGLPDDGAIGDEDAGIGDDLAAAADLDDERPDADFEDLDELERLRLLEDLAGIAAEEGDDEDEDDESFD